MEPFWAFVFGKSTSFPRESIELFSQEFSPGGTTGGEASSRSGVAVKKVGLSYLLLSRVFKSRGLTADS